MLSDTGFGVVVVVGLFVVVVGFGLVVFGLGLRVVGFLVVVEEGENKETKFLKIGRF